MNDNIYKVTAQYITGMFEEYGHSNLVYHDLGHTRKVVQRAQEIAAHYQLNEEDMLAVYIAAWFHDTGHLFTEIADHEEKSVELMRSFMAGQNAESSLTDKVAGCIMATKMPHEPRNLLQEILCDADTYHFGTKEFKKTNKKIRKEYKLRHYNAPLLNWEKNTLDLLTSHRFFTTYCQALLKEGKQKNIDWLRKKYLQSTNEKNLETENEAESDAPTPKQRYSLVVRGIQTMLRLTSENHLRLSEMADSKANILISVNSIIISVILSVLVRKLETDTYLTIPTMIFLAFSVATIIVAIMSTNPKVSEGRFSKSDVINKKANLLFFGNFYKSSLEEYEWAMGLLMQDKEYLYGSLIKDIHQLGIVLGRKYKLIRLAYTIFTIGIVVSVIAFIMAALLKSPSQVTTVSMPAGTPL